MIAFLGEDKRQQEKIKSDPTFDYQRYNAKAGSALMNSMTYLQSRKK
jgi:hypothetical protein